MYEGTLSRPILGIWLRTHQCAHWLCFLSCWTSVHSRVAHACGAAAGRIFPHAAQGPLNKCLLTRRSAFNHDLQSCISFMKWKLPTVCTYPGQASGQCLQAQGQWPGAGERSGPRLLVSESRYQGLRPGMRLLSDDVKALTNHDNEAQDVEVDVTCSRGQQVAGRGGTRPWVPGRGQPRMVGSLLLANRGAWTSRN